MERVTSVFKNLFNLVAPEPLFKPKPQPQYLDYDVIEALNEANELVILHMPKVYSLSYR